MKTKKKSQKGMSEIEYELLVVKIKCFNSKETDTEVFHDLRSEKKFRRGKKGEERKQQVCTKEKPSFHFFG